MTIVIEATRSKRTAIQPQNQNKSQISLEFNHFVGSTYILLKVMFCFLIKKIGKPRIFIELFSWIEYKQKCTASRITKHWLKLFKSHKTKQQQNIRSK